MLLLAPRVFQAPEAPAAREIATREPDGSDWSISKPARALRSLRRPPNLWSLATVRAGGRRPAREIATREPDGSEWSISRPALALPPPTGTATRPSSSSPVSSTGIPRGYPQALSGAGGYPQAVGSASIMLSHARSVDVDGPTRGPTKE